MIMQSAFFKLANVIPLNEAVELLKNSVEKTYGKKGEKIVEMNKAAIDTGIDAVHKVNIPSSWKNAEVEPTSIKEEPDFIKKFKDLCLDMKEMNFLLVLLMEWKMVLFH